MSYTYCAILLLSPVDVLCKEQVSVRGGHSTIRCGEGLHWNIDSKIYFSVFSTTHMVLKV